MMAIVPSGSPLAAAFYSVFSEAESLILFSRYFPSCNCDLFLFRVEDEQPSLQRAVPYKLVKHKELQKIKSEL